VIGTVVVAAVVLAAQQPAVPFAIAVILKAAYGAALAAVITPLGLRAALACA
jgi:hypothetical protein